MSEMDLRPSSDTEKFEESEKSALFEALKQITLEQIEQVQDLRKKYPLDAIDLVSSNITHNLNLKEAVKTELSLLHAKIKLLIAEISNSIENASYSPTRISLEKMDLGYKEKERSVALVDADKKRLVSIRSLNLTIDVFNKFNIYIEEEINRSVEAKDTSSEKKMLLANAMIFYELTDFLIGFIDSFQILGIEELRKVYESSMSDLQSTKESISGLKSNLSDPTISGSEKEKVKTQIRYMESSIDQIENEWKKIFQEHEYCNSGIQKVLDLRSDLRSMRSRAEAQLKILESISILQLVKNSLGSFQNAFSSLSNIKLVPLDTDRVKRLLNIG